MKFSTLAAVCILGVMFVLMLGSVWNDSAIIDELAHIPAGFGYVTQLDYRLNPEHPPLIKALSSLVAQLAVHPRFPTDTPHWRDDINGQWSQGAVFLYGAGNDADRIIFWSRLPLILLTIFFGWIFFHWVRRRLGDITAILGLIFFAFSPTIITHARFVTTDLGAALGFFIGIAGFIAFLERPDAKRIALAGLLLGTAALLKFSTVLLAPILLILLGAWVVAAPRVTLSERIRMGSSLLTKTLCAGVVALGLVWAVYGIFTYNYPQERQVRDAEFLLGSYGFRPAADFDIALIRHPITRPLGEYVLGLLMVQQRSAGGNTVFYLGEVSGDGARSYFPLLYLVKEPLALHLATLLGLAIGIKSIRRASKTGAQRYSLRIRGWIAEHFVEFSALVLIAVYWIVSVRSPLNIGVRHVLPTFPFIYLLVSRQIASWLRLPAAADPQTPGELLKNIYRIYIRAVPRFVLVGTLILWTALSTIAAFPHYLSYYNGLVGGSRDGWRVAVDSNYDWGQDLKRLADFAEKNNIEKLALDYFGGADPRYYLGQKFEPWHSSRGPAHGWFAISASFRQGAFGTPAPGFIRKPEDSYEWLRPYAPVARVGESIFVYNLP